MHLGLYKEKIKAKGLFLLIVLSLIPYPSKPFEPFLLSVLDEKGAPVSFLDVQFDYCRYPTLDNEVLKFRLDENGQTQITSRYVWMNWLLRRGYDFLAITSRTGWSTKNTKLLVVLPHKKYDQDVIRVGAVNFPNPDNFSEVISFSLDYSSVIKGYFYYGTPLLHVRTLRGSDSDEISIDLMNYQFDKMQLQLKTIKKM